MKNREDLIAHYSRMKQFKNLPKEEIEKLVDKRIANEELKNSFVGLKDDEVEKAVEKYNKYLIEHSFENPTEKDILITIVYLEILKQRIQEFIKTESEQKQGALPMRMTEKLLEIDTQIMMNKEKIGMLKAEKQDTIAHKWEELRQKCLKYYEEHAAEFYQKCPHCKNLFASILPPDKLEPSISSWFKRTTLYNEEVFNLYHAGKLTAEEAGKIMGVSKFYIELQYKEIYIKEKDVTQSK